MEGASSAWYKTTSTNCQLIWDHGKHMKTVELDENSNVTKFKSASGSIKSVINCMSLEEQIGLLDQESIGHASPRTNFHIGLAEYIYLSNENAQHLNSDHSTTSTSYSEGSTNGN
eukprot:1771871-Ditylum_brightwellii.AAC.2